MGLYWLLKWLCERWPALADEPLFVRWLRALADHPMRATLALLLTWLAIAGPARRRGAR
jgi:hypothetical protein